MLDAGFAPHDKNHFQIKFDCEECSVIEMDENTGKSGCMLLNHKYLTRKKPDDSE